MGKTEVDLEALAAAISQTILGFAKPQTEAPQAKKRGRPKKEKPELSQGNPHTWFKDIPAKTEIITVRDLDEEDEKFLEDLEKIPTEDKTVEIEIVHKPQTGIAPSKKIERTPDGDKTIAVKRPWEPPKKIKFMDTGEHMDKREDTSKWPQKDRRPPATKQQYECRGCGRTFEAYPSEVSGGEFIRCQFCIEGLPRPNYESAQ